MRPFLTAVVAFVIGCFGCGKLASFNPPTIEMTIEGSSMEPRLHGERNVYRCDECKRIVWFSNDRTSAYDSSRCPWCSQVLREDSVPPRVTSLPAQRVAVESVNAETKLRRYDKVVVHDDANNRHEVKRMIGFPHETVRIIDGDLWINGERASKSLPQFLDQAVVVDRWLEPIGEWQVPHACFQYQSTNLWPRTDDSMVSHPSPILDDYKMSRTESRWLIPVRDIGVRIELDSFPSKSAELEIGLTIGGSILMLEVEIAERKWRLKESRHSFESEVLVAAFVDGRLLVGTDDEGVSAIGARETHGESSPHLPIAVRLVAGNLRIREAHILRDLHYRGADGEGELALPGVIGYHLIGDNIADSFDSRSRWPAGVAREKIVGRVTGARSIRDECKLLSPASFPTSTSRPLP